METEALRGWCTCRNHGCGHVSALADQVAARGVVFEHGCLGPDRSLHSHEYFPLNLILYNLFRRSARPMALSEPIRRCRLL